MNLDEFFLQINGNFGSTPPSQTVCMFFTYTRSKQKELETFSNLLEIRKMVHSIVYQKYNTASLTTMLVKSFSKMRKDNLPIYLIRVRLINIARLTTDCHNGLLFAKYSSERTSHENENDISVIGIK